MYWLDTHILVTFSMIYIELEVVRKKFLNKVFIKLIYVYNIYILNSYQWFPFGQKASFIRSTGFLEDWTFIQWKEAFVRNYASIFQYFE